MKWAGLIITVFIFKRFQISFLIKKKVRKKISLSSLIKTSFVWQKMIFWKLLFKFFCVCLPLKKLVNKKYFSVKEKFGLVSRKVFSFYFGRKTLSRSCENFRNIILFADYNKFDLQTFDCYIFCFESFFFNFTP
jgi:hypothetical protein